MKIKNTAKFLISVLLAQLAGFVGSIFTSPSIPGWYAGLAKPSFTPPSWVFAPVWTTLFLLMGVAAFLVWKEGLEKKSVKIALVFFLLQLAFNSLWSYIFFGLHNVYLAFWEIIVLWFLILATIILFWRVSRLAAWLLIPYILWVSFAAFLNFSIWQLSASPVGKVSCPQDARQCPDGSYVGRRGSKCEFAACSGGPSLPDGYTSGWQITFSTSSGWSFQYPEQLGTTYLGPQDWPPILRVLDRPFACISNPNADRKKNTELKSIGNRSFCVTTENEGAAGSIYTSYLYDFEIDNQTASLSFTIRYPQCANYDEPRQTACENERAGFDPDRLALQMASTLKKP